MPPWISQIFALQKKESKSGKSRWVQLATIGLDNTPRVRTVVFRGWSDNYDMQIFTDKRSEKFYELEFNNNVEICWLFSKSRCQFRFRGVAKVDFSNDSVTHWEKLDNKSKSMWNWPSPGEKIDNHKKYIISEKINQRKLDNFALLKIKINNVDQLLLEDPIHIRKRWIRKNEWIEERINP